MKLRQLALPCLVFASLAAAQPGSNARPNLVILDPIAIENLRIETAVAEPGDFEETIFALGRIEVYPGRRAVVSSRIEGRALEVFIKHDHPIEKGEPAVIVESRQFAEPPPRVTLTAPMSGIVSFVNIAPGEPISPDRSLAEILDLSDVYALAQVPEHLAGRLRRGQKARIRVPAVPDRHYEAELEHLGVVTNEESGTIEAAFRVKNENFALRPKMRAEFSIIIAEQHGVVSVPRSAVLGDPADRYVFVRDFDLPNAFIKTPVVIGQSNEERVEIVRGLLPADEVVVRGAYPLSFAGGGTVSLKEALDAAHGHEHNPDGSEMGEASPKATEAPGHEHGEAPRGPARFWMMVSGVLAVLLLIVSFRQRRTPKASKAAEPDRP